MLDPSTVYKKSFEHFIAGRLLTDQNRKRICTLARFIRKAGVKRHQLAVLQEQLDILKGLPALKEFIRRHWAERRKAGRAWRATLREVGFKPLLPQGARGKPLGEILPEAIAKLAERQIEALVRQMQTRRRNPLFPPSGLRSSEAMEKLKQEFYPAAFRELYLAVLRQYTIDGAKLG